MIEVILLERIERLGQLGQVVKVRPGFARNFLLPHKKALRATKANIDVFEKQRVELEALSAAERKVAEGVGSKLEGLTLVIIRQASEMGQLYGSVSARDVSDAAKEAGHNIQRMQVQIDTPIKTLGLSPVKVRLHPEVTILVTVNVARSPEEAAVQAQKAAAAPATTSKSEFDSAIIGEASDADESKPAKTKKPAEASEKRESKSAKKAKAKPAEEARDEKPAAPKKKKAKA